MSRPDAIGYLRSDISRARQCWDEEQIRTRAKRLGYNLRKTVVFSAATERRPAGDGARPERGVRATGGTRHTEGCRTNWREFAHRCDLPLYLALVGATEIADRTGSPEISIDHLLTAMTANPETLPVKSLDGRELFPLVLVSDLLSAAIRRTTETEGG